ncbi:hypothetical protein BH10CYA1_BH10CYA1_61900 [soil metagenome]
MLTRLFLLYLVMARLNRFRILSSVQRGGMCESVPTTKLQERVIAHVRGDQLSRLPNSIRSYCLRITLSYSRNSGSGSTLWWHDCRVCWRVMSSWVRNNIGSQTYSNGGTFCSLARQEKNSDHGAYRFNSYQFLQSFEPLPLSTLCTERQTKCREGHIIVSQPPSSNGDHRRITV